MKYVFVIFIASICSLSAQAEISRTIRIPYAFTSAKINHDQDGHSIADIKDIRTGYLLEQADQHVGEPMIPLMTGRVMIENGETISSIKVVERTFDLVYLKTPLALVKKALRTCCDQQDLPVSEGKFENYPPKPVLSKRIDFLHGRRIESYLFSPVKYVSSLRLLILNRTMVLEIQLEKTPPPSAKDLTTPKVYTSSMLNDLANFIDNTNEFNDIIKDGGFPTKPLDEQYEYIIIAPENFHQAYQPLLDWRQAQGLSVLFQSIEDIEKNYQGSENDDLADKMRSFIRHAYEEWAATFIVLGGDTNLVPYRGVYAKNNDYESKHIESDLYFACLDGSWNGNVNSLWGEEKDGINEKDIDRLNEVSLGRLAADNTEDVEAIVAKIIAHETTIQPKRVFLVGEKLDKLTFSKGMLVKVFEDEFPTETWTSFGLFDKDLDEPWKFKDLNELIDSETFSVLNHSGHSNKTFNMKTFAYQTKSFANQRPFLDYSTGCHPAEFATSNGFGEYITMKIATGAFAYIGNTDYGWYFPGMTSGGSINFMHAFYEEIFDKKNTFIGVAQDKSKRRYVNGSDLNRWIVFALNLLGDPATRLFTGETPELSVLNLDNDSSVAGKVLIKIEAKASGDDEIDRVHLLLDGNPIASTAVEPYEVTIDFSKIEKGAHHFQAVAHTRKSGINGQSLPLTIE